MPIKKSAAKPAAAKQVQSVEKHEHEDLKKELADLKKQCNQCCGSLSQVSELSEKLSAIEKKLESLDTKAQPLKDDEKLSKLLQLIKSSADYGKLKRILEKTL